MCVLALVACSPPVTATRPDPHPPKVTAAAAPDVEVRAAIERFVRATNAQDFKTALGLLAAPLRGRYTPERLARDFDVEPLAKERLARIEAALALPISVADGRATLPLGGARALKLVREDGAWRIAALE